MKIAKNISFCIIISFIICCLSNYIKSSFLSKFLTENIITLQVTLLAINTATLGLIASKIQEILDRNPTIDFEKTIKEMKFSLTEQIVLIIISFLSLVLLSNNEENIINFEYKKLLLDTILLGALIYYIDILRDTGKAVFIVIDLINKINRNSKIS